MPKKVHNGNSFLCREKKTILTESKELGHGVSIKKFTNIIIITFNNKTIYKMRNFDL